MTRERCKKLLPVMQAWVEGKQVQLSVDRLVWHDEGQPTWGDGYYYRIKLEPRSWWLAVYPESGTVCEGFRTEEAAVTFATVRNLCVVHVVEDAP